jgi:hypothetical protein
LLTRCVSYGISISVISSVDFPQLTPSHHPTTTLPEEIIGITPSTVFLRNEIHAPAFGKAIDYQRLLLVLPWKFMHVLQGSLLAGAVL